MLQLIPVDFHQILSRLSDVLTSDEHPDSVIFDYVIAMETGMKAPMALALVGIGLISAAPFPLFLYIKIVGDTGNPVGLGLLMVVLGFVGAICLLVAAAISLSRFIRVRRSS